MQETKLVRVQEKGQVTLPAAVRRKYGIKKGDLVGFRETAEGVLITPKAVIAAQALDEIGVVLRERGVDLDELIANGRKIRGELIKEMYGIDATDDD